MPLAVHSSSLCGADMLRAVSWDSRAWGAYSALLSPPHAGGLGKGARELSKSSLLQTAAAGQGKDGCHSPELFSV